MAANFSPCVDKTILVSLLTIDKEYLFIEFLSGRLKYSSDFARIPPMIINSGLNMLISAAMPRPSFSPISLIASIASVSSFLAARIISLRRTSSIERSEEHTSELQSRENLVCRLLLEKKKHHEE